MPDLNHREALELLTDDWTADSDNREDALQDLMFLSGDQWTENERTERENEGRPVLTINQLNGFVNQVAGDIRQAQPAIEVFPVDSMDDVPVARIYEGLIRQIEYQSGAQSAYAHGAESAVRCGVGHWRFETDFTTDSVFEQDIKIKRILDPLAVIWDAGAVEIDRADAQHVWVTDWVHENEFKRRFGIERKANDVPVDGDRGSSGLYWRRDKFIRIAEYWYLKPSKRQLVLLPDGRTIDITELDEVGQFQALSAAVRERTIDGFKVKRRVLDGSDWLEDEKGWPGRFLPIVPIIGAEVAFDNKIIRHGLIRFAKDAQKLYNFWASAGAELIGKSPKAPWLVTPKMIQGWEGHWNNANRSNLPYLPFNIDPASGGTGGKPERQQPPTVPAAMWQERAMAVDDMKKTTGIFDASLGAQGNETSGRAILARQREGDVGSFLYTDNFAQAMRRSGQILVDLIPRIYDTERQVRILDVDGTEAFVRINTSAMGIDGQPVLINDLSTGRFDVRVKVGASYTTARVEAREQMAQAMANNPELWRVFGDLFFKNSDYPGADEISERLRRAIPPELLEDQQAQPPNPVEEAVQRLEIAAREAEVADKEASAMKKQAETEKIGAETIRTIEETAAL